jgi:hypothetical protein
MNQRTSQPAARVDLRQSMPETAKWVDIKRQELGAEFVNGCIRRAMRGEPGFFYALERGHVLGTPFPASHPVAQDQNYAITTGCTFAGFIATPVKVGTTDGTH